MSRNYEYIISSLPALSRDWRFKANASFGTWLEWLKSQLDDADKKTVDALLDGFKDENLDRGFYQAALSHGNAFIRNYFTFDLNVRNAKVREAFRNWRRVEDYPSWDNIIYKKKS